MSVTGTTLTKRFMQQFAWQVPANLQHCRGLLWPLGTVTLQHQNQDRHCGRISQGVQFARRKLGRLHRLAISGQSAERNSLQEKGVKKGDRVAIVMPQRFETAVAYMAVLQMGAVAMPLVDAVWS